LLSFYYGGGSDIYIFVHFGETLGGLGIAQVLEPA
jgi:hypothetical protein